MDYRFIGSDRVLPSDRAGIAPAPATSWRTKAYPSCTQSCGIDSRGFVAFNCRETLRSAALWIRGSWRIGAGQTVAASWLARDCARGKLDGLHALSLASPDASLGVALALSSASSC